MVKQAIGERRRHSRVKRILSVQFKLVKSKRKGADRSLGLSTTEDLSSGGLSFYTDREYCAGDILDVHVIMSGILDIYKGYGEVVRVDRKESGVCFLAAIKFIGKEQAYRGLRAPRSIKKSRIQGRL